MWKRCLCHLGVYRRDHLDDHKKKYLLEVRPISGPTYNEGKTVYISKSGLYSLILRSNYQRQDRSSNKKNDRLYQRTTYNHIHRPPGCGKTYLVLGLIEKEYNKHFDYIIIIRLTL